ncbi:hypothetical protein DENSPDRAFT_795350 [Dentipellis sp. KUC8613]|nr:hypothetical protein DENSPDRAFT_795350 [Dentipellis sp. KUC8613]
MASKRDSSLFSSGSIGRAQGSQIQRGASPAPSLTREPLTAHPLLSPTPSTVSVNTTTSPETQKPSTVATAPHYVPYTPRHRTAAATTGTTSLSVSPQQQQGGGATSKLQLMNLKASAQSVGLDTGSIGWEILEKLVGEHDHAPEWNEIWSALATGKATLLLPLEQGSHGNITPDFVKDHIALCNGDSRDSAPIVTLSGIRGVLADQTLTFRSSLRPGSKVFEELLNASTRPAALAALPPLPLISPSPLSQTYPTLTVPSYTASLPLPPHIAAKPPLPPRPGQRPSSSQGTSSRLSTSFASLFGKSSTSSTPVPTPPLSTDSEHAVEVSAFTIDRRIIRKDVTKQINKSIKLELKEALTMSGAPNWIIDRVNEFTVGLYPFVKSSHSIKQQFLNANGSAPPSPIYTIDPPTETIEELSQQFQEFYEGLEEDLRAGHSPVTARPKGDTFSDAQEKDLQKRSHEHKDKGSDQYVRDTLEAVERVMCSLFYDRLYLQRTSDDASHDAALSDRIAALNMLDLGLEHLGVDAGTAATDIALASVLRGCGETLSQLDQSACRCPADKAAILVAAHKILVDGLSRLPPIRLKSEAELEHQKSPEAAAVVHPKKPASVDDSEKQDDEVSSEPSRLLTDLPAVPPIIVSPESDPNLQIPSPAVETDTSSLSADAGLGPRAHVTPPPRTTSLLTMSRPSTPTPVSGDLILPLMIYAVVKANPQHLISHLLYTQRFRYERFGGEESYCLVNLMAVADFLENVDLKALGLGDSEKKVMSTADLTPIPVTRAALGSQSPTSPEGIQARLRGRVEQQVDAITGSANKVISGVVDSSFGVLRSLLPGSADTQTPGLSPDQDVAPWNAVRPGFGLLRRESGFSIASLAASLPGRERSKSINSTAAAEESGQQMIEVASRPGSVRSAFLSDADVSETDGSEEDEEEDDDDDEEEEGGHDTRSIRSFENMMKDKRRKRDVKGRKSLTDRLASMPGLSRLSTNAAAPTIGSPPASRRSSLLPAATGATRFDTPVSSRAHSPVQGRLPPPSKRFMECTEDDLKVSEVAELLREYKRLVEGVRAIGGFDD